jgi:dTDP-4-amino-4,6-dideoxygalactose transaminase
MINVFGSRTGAEEAEAVKDCLERQWMGMGPKTREFETAMSDRLGLKGMVMLNSGSNALYMAIKLLKLPEGSEIIVPSFTWISCAHAVVLNKCKVVFADVDLNTHNITAETIRPCMTRNTKAIMVVHYAGKPCDMQPILDLGVPVVEDAAHAVDSTWQGKYCGGIGAVGIYSFDAVKNLAVGEGGGLTANDPALIEKARINRYCGIGKSGFEASTSNKSRWWEYNISDFDHKYLPSDVAAAIGLAQLKKLDDMQAYRKRIWDRYQKEWASLEWLVQPVGPDANEKHSYFTYCVRVLGGNRDKFAKYLLDSKIYTTLRYHPLHLNAIYKSDAKLPVSEQLNEEALSLPIHPNLSDADVTKIIDAVANFSRKGL